MKRALRQRGFAVPGVTDMDGWLAYHAAFVACVAAALCRCGTDAARLAADRQTLTLMCAAVTEAFAALRAAGVTGLPRNLARHHHWPPSQASPGLTGGNLRAGRDAPGGR
jgi:ketopantoate reductase